MGLFKGIFGIFFLEVLTGIFLEFWECFPAILTMIFFFFLGILSWMRPSRPGRCCWNSTATARASSGASRSSWVRKIPAKSLKILGNFFRKNQEFWDFPVFFQPPERSGSCRAPPRGGCWSRDPQRRCPRRGSKKNQENPKIFPPNIPGIFKKRLFRVVIGWCGCQSEGSANHRAGGVRRRCFVLIGPGVCQSK